MLVDVVFFSSDGGYITRYNETATPSKGDNIMVTGENPDDILICGVVSELIWRFSKGVNPCVQVNIKDAPE